MKKFEVYFGRRPVANMKLLQTFDNNDDAVRFICKRIKEFHEPNYCIRSWLKKRSMVYDYGSWSEFYATRTVK